MEHCFFKKYMFNENASEPSIHAIYGHLINVIWKLSWTSYFYVSDKGERKGVYTEEYILSKFASQL